VSTTAPCGSLKLADSTYSVCSCSSYLVTAELLVSRWRPLPYLGLPIQEYCQATERLW
jgi:hypothetical protein